MASKYYGSMEEKPVDESSEGLLEDSLNVTEESERVGEETLTKLQAQSEQIQGASTAASETRGAAKKAKDVLRNIEFKILKEKIVLALIILALLGIDAGLAYLLVVNKGSFSGKKR